MHYRHLAGSPAIILRCGLHLGQSGRSKFRLNFDISQIAARLPWRNCRHHRRETGGLSVETSSGGFRSWPFDLRYVQECADILVPNALECSQKTAPMRSSVNGRGQSWMVQIDCLAWILKWIFGTSWGSSTRSLLRRLGSSTCSQKGAIEI
jgi:hypothetical protein